jgi:hypothetical protein
LSGGLISSTEDSQPKRGEGQGEGFKPKLRLLTPALSSFGEEREKAECIFLNP